MAFRVLVHSLLGLCVLSTSGCSVDFDVYAAITVPEDIRSAHDETNRGVLVAVFDGDAREEWILCGEEEEDLEVLSGHFESGCPKEVQITVFVAPADPDDERPCGEIERADVSDSETSHGGVPMDEWPQDAGTASHWRGVCKVDDPITVYLRPE
jgi:hypothetical protein